MAPPGPFPGPDARGVPGPEARAGNLELKGAPGKTEIENSAFVKKVGALEHEIQELRAAGEARSKAPADVERFFAKGGRAPRQIAQQDV